MAMILSIGRNVEAPTFAREDFIIAENIVRSSIEYMEHLAENHMAETLHEARRQQILKHLRKNPESVSREKLKRQFRQIRGQEFDNIIADMLAQDAIIEQRINERPQGVENQRRYRYKG